MSGSVLCAIDISASGGDEVVLNKAKQLADLEGATLDVMTVLPDFGKSIVGSFFEGDHTAKATAAAKTALNAYVERCLGADNNTNVRHIVAVGTAYEEILNVAETAKSGLIVIGAHKLDFKDYLLGPNAARVVRHSTCSVHVVR